MGRVSPIQTTRGPQLFPILCSPTLCFISHSKRRLGIKCSFRRFLPMSGSDQGKGSDVLDAQDRARFEQLVLPHSRRRLQSIAVAAEEPRRL